MSSLQQPADWNSARGESALKTFERTNLASHRQDLEDELRRQQDKRKTLKPLEQG
jgi:hypothetical protein